VAPPTIHLHPTAPAAPRALLPGDPGRALALAQALLDQPKMFNHNRGLWGYTGTASDGRLLTIQATGMGGPSAAIVVEELADLGVETAVRIGTCGALADGCALGDLVAAHEVLCVDGTSRALGAGDRVAGDPALTAALAARADHAGLVATTDLFYDPDESRVRRWSEQGAIAVEMEAAAVIAVGARRGMRVACLLGVSDSAIAGGVHRRIAAEALAELGLRLGRTALDALA
jgi:DeoD family purine-nucleoside phosphorylase